MDTIEQELRDIAKKGKEEVLAYVEELRSRGIIDKKELARKIFDKYSIMDLEFYFSSSPKEVLNER